MYVILSRSCDGCNKTSLTALMKKPSDDEIHRIENELGGMYCIRTEIVQLKMGETKEVAR